MNFKTILEIIEGPVNPNQVTSTLGDPGHGAQSFFFGAVRDLNHGRKVTAVSYECHKAISQKVLGEIIAEARTKWGSNLDAVVMHCTGRLAVGEMSVGIGISTPHRDEAFEACRYIIEQLKVRVPIWKQEHYVDGDSEWLKGHELCQHGKKHEDPSGHTSGRS